MCIVQSSVIPDTVVQLCAVLLLSFWTYLLLFRTVLLLYQVYVRLPTAVVFVRVLLLYIVLAPKRFFLLR